MASDLAPEWVDELERLERECRESWDAVSNDRYRLRCDLSVELLTHARALIEAARERDRLRAAIDEAITYLHQMPFGIDPEGVDPDNLTPVDAASHVGSLAARVLIEALERKDGT